MENNSEGVPAGMGVAGLGQVGRGLEARGGDYGAFQAFCHTIGLATVV